MRFLYVLFLAVTFQTVISQNKFVPVDTPYQTALENAKKEGKPLFVMLYADWCPHCNLMKSEVLSDPAVMDFLNKNFVCTYKNIEKEEGIALKKQIQHKITSYFFIFGC
ncbi:thioredoxin family protein [Flavobacterium sp. CGRL2]